MTSFLPCASLILRARGQGLRQNVRNETGSASPGTAGGSS